MNEPDIATDYDDRGARAAHSVLVELGQVLGAHRDAIVIIGGAVPSLLIKGQGHIGTLDIDLDLTESITTLYLHNLVRQHLRSNHQDL